MRLQDPLIIEWSKERAISRRGVLWLGLKCDVRCKFCYDAKLPTKDKVWVKFNEIKKSLDRFRYFYENRYIDFMGGEPTLHPQIYEIVRYAAQIGLRPTIITHGMGLSNVNLASKYIDSGINDFLISIHGTGQIVRKIHDCGQDNFEKQVRGLENLKILGIPFRFNCTMIKDNISEMENVAILAVKYGARVVNFVTFNPYFEWANMQEIQFQARHSDIVPALRRAIDICVNNNVEVNVRYMPICQLPGYEHHVYTGFQLPYDTHEWDYNSWYDLGVEGQQSKEWYIETALLQKTRHGYHRIQGCTNCSVSSICDGFHSQYVARWGSSEPNPYGGRKVLDPTYFISNQDKLVYKDNLEMESNEKSNKNTRWRLSGTQFNAELGNRAGTKKV